MRLQFNAEGVVLFIAQGWRQPTLGYACSEEVNAVGVVRFLSGIFQRFASYHFIIHLRL